MSDLPLEFFEKMPKVDLHRHLEGSLQLNTVMEIARTHGIPLPKTAYLRMQSTDRFSSGNFLAKFHHLRHFYRSPEIIARITREAIEDAALDNIQYLELRFTPAALGMTQGYAPQDVITWVCDAARQAACLSEITVRLIISVNRHEPVEQAARIAQVAVDFRAQGVVALDLAGNEAEYPIEPFVPVFRQAKEAGLQLTVHAGEWGGAINVKKAIELIQAVRIAHGVRVLEDESIMALARERQVPFEVCLTSNYHSGVVPTLISHPLPAMIANGLTVTFGTDDPSISQITLSDEYRLAVNDLGLSLPDLRRCIRAAGQASFLPTNERLALSDALKLS